MVNKEFAENLRDVIEKIDLEILIDEVGPGHKEAIDKIRPIRNKLWRILKENCGYVLESPETYSLIPVEEAQEKGIILG